MAGIPDEVVADVRERVEGLPAHAEGDRAHVSGRCGLPVAGCNRDGEDAAQPERQQTGHHPVSSAASWDSAHQCDLRLRANVRGTARRPGARTYLIMPRIGSDAEVHKTPSRSCLLKRTLEL